MSDRIALVNGGRIEQLGEVHEIYHRPVTAFAAEFIGQSNLLTADRVRTTEAGCLVQLTGGLELELLALAWPAQLQRAIVSIRPEKLHVSKQLLTGKNTFVARVDEEVFRGATDRLALTAEAGTKLTAIVANESALREPIHAGDKVWCALHEADIVVVPEPR
jgi:spermidine/putrescine transport system ATP-binding protein